MQQAGQCPRKLSGQPLSQGCRGGGGCGAPRPVPPLPFFQLA